MAIYKMTVMFNIHDDEIGNVKNDPFKDGTFLNAIMRKLEKIGALSFNFNKMPMRRTTYEIISCKKMKE
jgi:hypothetical protein